jgi:ABC-type glycerol-3-phosphate transport system substrate-binding protein
MKVGLLLLACAYALATAVIVLRPGREHRGDRVTIRVSHWQLEGGVRQGFAAVIRRYEELNPRVHVVQIVVPDRLYNGWAPTQLVGGSAPDVVEYNKDFSAYVVQQYFEPLGDEVMRPNPYNRGTALEKVPWRDTYLDAMQNQDGFNRQLNQYYAATLSQHSIRMVCNLELLREISGQDRPPADYRSLVRFYAQVEAYRRTHPKVRAAIANSHDTVIALMGTIYNGTVGSMMAAVDHRHALRTTCFELGLDYLQGDWRYGDPVSLSGLRYAREFGDASMPGFLQLTRDTALTDFVEGRAPMVVAPSWESTSLRQLCPFEIAAFRYPLPARGEPGAGPGIIGPSSDGSLITMLAMYLNRNSAHRAEALDFMKFLTSLEGNRIFSEVSGWLPAITGVRVKSAFSAEFLPVYDGYSWDSDLFTLSGDNARQLLRSSYYLLYGPMGSPEKYAAALDAGMRKRIILDLGHESRQELRNLRGQDLAGAARHFLSGDADFPLALLPARLEGRTAQMVLILREAQRLAAPSATRPWTPPAERREDGPATPPVMGPGLTAAWTTLANYRPDLALPMFERVGRENRLDQDLAALGRAACLMADETQGPAEIGKVEADLSRLADGPGRDLADAALFMLGRLESNRREPTDPIRAAAILRTLVTRDTGSVWAQAAIPRLVILLLYTPAGPADPRARLSAAAQLRDLARSAPARTDLEILIADAVFHWRLPPLEALPHLLEAEKSGAMDPETRSDVLVQLGELSRLAGRWDDAQRHYRTYLALYPRDFRNYPVRRRLAGADDIP